MSVSGEILLRVSDLRKEFPGRGIRRRHAVKAVDGVSFTIRRGETLGLVGESGSGKSTLGRMIAGLIASTSGDVVFERDKGLSGRALWRKVQMVFQDPYSSLNPKLTIRDILAEPLRNFDIARGISADHLIKAMLDTCGLGATAMDRYPRSFSGGQRQRIGIARALIVQPEFIVADEAVSALDVSIQAQIINLLQDMKVKFGLTYLFIAHDLAVVRHVSDWVAVIYLGKLVEIGRVDDIYTHPLHPYTQLLLQSIPRADPRLEAERVRAIAMAVQRDVPAQSTGCSFAARCPAAQFPRCHDVAPVLKEAFGAHSVACHFAPAAGPES